MCRYLQVVLVQRPWLNSPHIGGRDLPGSGGVGIDLL